MPKDKEISHPCHLLSLPSAKRFWCRHCMTVFEDAITRWRHSRSCRYGVVNNFMRRRELEAKALQNTTVLNPVEARLEQSIQMCDLASASIPVERNPNNQNEILPNAETFNCLICHEKFASMEEMRVHVKYPCSNSKIVTTHVPHPKHSVPVFIDALPGHAHQWKLPPQHPRNEVHPATSFIQANTPQHLSAQTSYDIKIESQQVVESSYDNTEVVYDHSGSSNTTDSITPTNIYVNEEGETVIEVENFDLNSEGGELSLAHLLTQLSRQGIVFDKARSAQLQAQHEVTVSVDSANTLYTTTPETHYHQTVLTAKGDEEEGQPSAEDAANTLAQLAGFRGFSRNNLNQADDTRHIHTQTPSFEGYSYSSSSELSGSYTASQPHIDEKYEYEYSDSLPTNNLTIVSSQQAVVTMPQEGENINIDHNAMEDADQFYHDPCNVSYIPNPDNHSQIHIGTDKISGIQEMKPNCVDDSEPETVLIQHYPVQISGSGELTIASDLVASEQIHETHEILLPTSHDVGVLIADLETNVTTQEVTDSTAAETSENATDNPVNTDDEFATPAVSLTEIIDS